MTSSRTKRRIGHAPLLLAATPIAGWIAYATGSSVLRLVSAIRARRVSAGVVMSDLVQALIILSSWHLSQGWSEVADIRAKIDYSGCELLIGLGA